MGVYLNVLVVYEPFGSSSCTCISMDRKHRWLFGKFQSLSAISVAVAMSCLPSYSCEVNQFHQSNFHSLSVGGRFAKRRRSVNNRTRVFFLVLQVRSRDAQRRIFLMYI